MLNASSGDVAILKRKTTGGTSMPAENATKQQPSDGGDNRSINPNLRLRLEDNWEINGTLIKGFVITYPCPHCRNELQSSLDEAGREGKCPFCGGMFAFLSGAERDQIQSAIAAVYEQRRQRRAAAEEAEAEAKSAAMEAKRLKAEAKQAATKAKRDASRVWRHKMWQSFIKPYWKQAMLVVAVAVIASSALWIAGRLISPNRYTMINGGNGVVYKLDRRTGKTWSLRKTYNGHVETPVATPE
jgi:hypothetical protein